MFAIRTTFTVPPPPVVGWVLDGTKVAVYTTQEEAERAMNKLRRDGRYSWRNARLEVAEYKEKR